MTAAVQIEHDLRAQRAYAYDRAGHLELVSRMIALAGIVTGGAVFTELSSSGIGKYVLGVLIPIIGGAEIVFNFAKRAEQWREIARESDAMLTQLEASSEITSDFLTGLSRRYDKIVLPQERMFNYARAVAWNVAARERGITEREGIPKWRVLTRNIFPGRPDC